MAAAAGFYKVAWDGTADTYPSRRITDQLTKPVAVELDHRAHEAGQLTYFSAGSRFSNIPAAVTSNVDGIEIGRAQILRYMDKRTGNHGTLLAVRDESSDSVPGRGAQLPARLDRLYYEGTRDLRRRSFPDRTVLDAPAGRGNRHQSHDRGVAPCH